MNYLLIGGAVAFALLVGAFYWYYKDSQSTISDLTEKNAELTVVNAVQEKTIQTYEQRTQQIKEQREDLDKNLVEAEKRNDADQKAVSAEQITEQANSDTNAATATVNGLSDALFGQVEKATGGTP